MIRTILLALALAAPASAQTNPALGTATSGDGAVVSLYARPGPCLGNARLAEHKTRAGAVTPGCWLLTSNGVVIAFLDGERGEIPAALMVWAKDI
jgi:hypothetical protein